MSVIRLSVVVIEGLDVVDGLVFIEGVLVGAQRR